MNSDAKIFPRTSVCERPFWFRFLFVWRVSTNIRELIISAVYSKSIFDKEHLTEVTVGYTNTCIHTISPPRLFAVFGCTSIRQQCPLLETLREGIQ